MHKCLILSKGRLALWNRCETAIPVGNSPTCPRAKSHSCENPQALFTNHHFAGFVPLILQNIPKVPPLQGKFPHFSQLQRDSIFDRLDNSTLKTECPFSNTKFQTKFIFLGSKIFILRQKIWRILLNYYPNLFLTLRSNNVSPCTKSAKDWFWINQRIHILCFCS